MNRMIILNTVLILSLIVFVAIPLNIQKATAWTGGTITIMADGSIVPNDAPIQQIGGKYTLHDNISLGDNGIIVKRDNIVIDGADFALQGNGTGNGITVGSRSNVTIMNLRVIGFDKGVYMNYSTNNYIIGNTITFANEAIYIYSSSGNNISGNTISDIGWYGMFVFYYCSNNYIAANTISRSNIESIYLRYYCTNNSIVGNNITGNYCDGVYFAAASNNNIVTGNSITLNTFSLSHSQWSSEVWGIQICDGSGSNTISDNIIEQNTHGGILLEGGSGGQLIKGNRIVNNGAGIGINGQSTLCNDNNITYNTIAGNQGGLWMFRSNNDFVHHNNIVDNGLQISVVSQSTVQWDNGYPSGGNYWSNYTGVDLKSGIYQNETGSDGIGDTPYSIDLSNQDNYPLVCPTEIIKRTFTVYSIAVNIWTNSSVTGFLFNASSQMISFDAIGIEGTVGFCEIIIPSSVLSGTITMYNDGILLTPDVDYTQTFDGTNYVLNINYSHSTHTIAIKGTEAIPEFSSLFVIPLFMMATLLAVTLYRRKKPKAISVF